MGIGLIYILRVFAKGRLLFRSGVLVISELSLVTVWPASIGS